MKNKVLSVIKNFITTLIQKLTWKDFLLIFLGTMCVGLYIGARHYYHKALTPIVVYNTDSLEIYKNKIKDEYVAKDIYVQEVKDLKKQNTLLAQEVKNLKDNPIVITKTDIKVQLDTIYTEKVIIYKEENDSTYYLKWRKHEKNGYYAIDGETRVKSDFSDFSTIISDFHLDTNLTLDILDNGDKKLRLIGRTDNPYIRITNIDGAVFDPSDSKVLKKYYKQKRWSLGPYIGVGVVTNGKFYPQLGIGLSYGIFQF